MSRGRRAGRGFDDVGLPRARPLATWAATTLACLLVLLALLAPDELSRLTPGVFVSVPLEGLLWVALLLVLPTGAKSVAATLLGLALGLLSLVKLLDMGFFAVLARPFDPLLDWRLLDDAMRFLAGAIGAGPAIGSLAVAITLSTALVIFMTQSVQHLSRLVVRHNSAAARAVVVVAVPWLTCAMLAIQIVPGVPIAVEASAAYLRTRAQPTGTGGPHDRQSIAAAASADAFQNTPAKDLLAALRGKDVIIAFVESYGRDAVEDPEFAAQIGSILDAGDDRLHAAGFTSRSAFLTSPTAGGSSWLAHGTFLSGLWIDHQQRYDELAASPRLTLTRAFQRASWRTVGVMPGNDSAWPESGALGYDQIFGAKDMGYQGPRFSWATMPDQYALSRFEGTERTPRDRHPVMAEITLVSSHAPWEPIPRLVSWSEVGDGSVFDEMAAPGDPPEAILTRNPTRVRAAYRASIEYSLDTLISYVETYGNENLVLVFLGDHQPSPIVTGRGASRDVPISIVARDPSVFSRIAPWGWQEGLKPDPQAPVWRMDAFRDRFLTAFGAAGPAKRSPPVTAVNVEVRVR
ncbi:MAG TPA: CDP-alcohol phosphatidyltransferase family protein [Propionibacteriaceae bacterium]|nr:CDP-alcohol phosphatidyltransferase family protein [Propionibacteriaceae bacterium]